jgi:hypothetical protein
MDIRTSYPDYIPIEEHIRRAKLERSLVLAQLIAGGVDAFARGLRTLMGGLSGFARAKSDPPLALPREAAHR